MLPMAVVVDAIAASIIGYPYSAGTVEELEDCNGWSSVGGVVDWLFV